MQGSWEQQISYTNGHLPKRRPERRWRCQLRGIAIVWMVSLVISWLMGLGVIKILDLTKRFLGGT